MLSELLTVFRLLNVFRKKRVCCCFLYFKTTLKVFGHVADDTFRVRL